MISAEIYREGVYFSYSRPNNTHSPPPPHRNEMCSDWFNSLIVHICDVTCQNQAFVAETSW